MAEKKKVKAAPQESSQEDTEGNQEAGRNEAHVPHLGSG